MEMLSPDAGLLANIGLTRRAAPMLDGVDSAEKAAAAARAFEGLFVTQMMQAMFAGVKSPDGFGGGPGEDAFHGLLLEEYGKAVSAGGGIGLAAPLQAEIMRLQGL